MTWAIILTTFLFDRLESAAALIHSCAQNRRCTFVCKRLPAFGNDLCELFENA
jgi:hypothetical protein